MRALKRQSRSFRTQTTPGDEPGATVAQGGPGPLTDPDDYDDLKDSDTSRTAADLDDEVYEIFRVYCPDCARPIALLADEEILPEHAMCSSPWNPFGLTVCAGSGRSVADAGAVDGDEGAAEQDVAVLLTLPEGLNWRTQPFSHAGGPSSRPFRMPRLRGRRG